MNILNASTFRVLIKDDREATHQWVDTADNYSFGNNSGEEKPELRVKTLVPIQRLIEETERYEVELCAKLKAASKHYTHIDLES